MIKLLNKIDINSLIFKLVFFFLIFITSCYFYLNFNSFLNSSSYAFNELLINYQAGFIRRGLLGEIFWHLNNIFLIKPLIFFSYLFLILYFAQIYLFAKIFKVYKNCYIIFLIIILSPALILFPIYEFNLYFIKDIFVKLSILLHALILINKVDRINFDTYIKDLKFLIIPILTITVLIHEYQVIFISVHILLSLSLIRSKYEIKRILKIYLLLLIPIFLIFFNIGNIEQYENLNLVLKKFEIADVHPQLAGGFYKALGGFYKWHFYYFGYKDFVQLLLSLILGVGVFFIIFHFLITKKILKFNNKYQENYLYFFIPTILCFLLALDHGRNISLLSTHLVAFYAVLKLDISKLKKTIIEINKNFILSCSLIIFLFFYFFMWKLDQMSGFGGSEQINTIFKSSLFAECIKFIKFIYFYIDLNIIDLPQIRL